MVARRTWREIRDAGMQDPRCQAAYEDEARKADPPHIEFPHHDPFDKMSDAEFIAWLAERFAAET